MGVTFNPARHLRAAIEAEIEHLIDMLDQIDGDSDLEPDGDEQDHGFAEDDFCRHLGNGPGCPISDPGGTVAIYESHEDDEPDGEEIRKRHLARIRRTACDKIVTGPAGYRTTQYRLRH